MGYYRRRSPLGSLGPAGPVRRVAAPDCPVPFSPVLEKAYIPQVDDVVRALKELISY